MIKKVSLKNILSFREVEINLSPFTLLLGANGAGKSNFLKSIVHKLPYPKLKHFNHPDEPSSLAFLNHQDELWIEVHSDILFADPKQNPHIYPLPFDLPRHHPLQTKEMPERKNPRIYKLDPRHAGEAESLHPFPSVDENGAGVVRVLDSLKTGDREDLFNTIEDIFKSYIPEIEKLSFVPGASAKQLQVREKHIKDPVLVRHLSEGTRLVLIFLTLLYQERPPSLICIEDIDYGIHPRLLQKVIELCFDLAGKDGRPQIIATTHNPYVVDLFKDHEEAVLIVEKKEGYTTITSLAEKLNAQEIGENPLGELWFSGILGGVPQVGKR